MTERFKYLAEVHLNAEKIYYEIRDEKLWIDCAVKNGDSILLVSWNNDEWPSRRIFIGPGGYYDLYLHPDVLTRTR